MAENKKTSSPDSEKDKEYRERRREERYAVPSVYQRYIQLQVKRDNAAVQALLANFSRNGILFESPVPFDAGLSTDCILSIPDLLSKDIELKIEIKFCRSKSGSYLVGSAIESVASEMWFNVFVEVHDFIVQRQDSVY